MAILLSNQDPTTATVSGGHLTLAAGLGNQFYAKNAAGVARLLDEFALSGLTGGGTSNLDGIVTAGGAIAIRTIRRVESGTIGTDYQLSTWVLKAGTYADNPTGGYVRPLDYATTTNEVVWVQAG